MLKVVGKWSKSHKETKRVVQEHLGSVGGMDVLFPSGSEQVICLLPDERGRRGSGLFAFKKFMGLRKWFKKRSVFHFKFNFNNRPFIFWYLLHVMIISGTFCTSTVSSYYSFK